jgi:F-type H+-transporting ATPase subunit gamma
MANRRVLVKRRKASRNIRKITRTMQLVATARFQAAFNRATAAKPYTEKLAEVVADLSRALADSDVRHPLMTPAPGATKAALVVLTSNRGLAGAYNSNVLRTAIAWLEERKAQGLATDVTMVGKKGAAYFRYTRQPMAEQVTSVGDVPRFDQVEPVATALMTRFLKGEIGSLHVAYMRFLSAGQQRPEVVQLLPLAAANPPLPPAGEGRGEGSLRRRTEYEFIPDAASLLEELLPATVRVRLFQAFNDAVVSEQVARMVAMKAATDAAEEMIKRLTRDYNRARQTSITMELLDIVGGANALA